MDAANLEKILVSRDIHPTAMRLLVLQEMSGSETAMSLNELEVRLNRADRVTLYRTLKTFQQHKLVHAVDDGTGSLKYALCSDDCDCAPDDMHAHFHCNRCEVTFCLKDYHLNTLSVPRKFKVEDINLVIKGLCDRCSGK